MHICAYTFFNPYTQVFLLSNYYWMDLKRRDGGWKWGDGTPYTWSAWFGAEPTTQCGVGDMNNNYEWVIADCDNFVHEALVLCEARGTGLKFLNVTNRI